MAGVCVIETMMDGTDKVFDLSELPKGNYILDVKQDGDTATKILCIK
jgi:hypothetical protein